MAEGSTLFLIKPDAVAAGATEQIEALIEAANFAVIARLEVVLSPSHAANLYEDRKGSADFEEVVELMSSGPSVALALQKKDGVAACLELLGPEDSVQAKATASGSVRAAFGTNAVRNAAHGSASVAAAERELRLFFPKTFPRELAVAVLAGPAAAADAPALLMAASSDDFLVVETRELRLPAAVAARYCEGQPAAAPALVSGVAVTAILLEKALATEDLLALAARVRAGEDGAPLLSAGVQLYVSRSSSAARAEAAMLFGDAALRPTLCFALLHPDSLGDAEEMLACAEAAGFTLLASRVLSLSEEQATQLHSVDDPKAIPSITEGPSLALALARPCAVSAWSSLMGNLEDQPSSLRAVYSKTHSACYGAASVADAENDLRLIFPSLYEHETTLGLLLPDAAPHAEEILEAAASAGLVVTSRQDAHLPRERAADFLRLLPAAQAPPDGSFDAAVDHMCSGPVTAIAFSGRGAVAQWAALLGPANPLIAKVRCPGCLRARFGADATRAVGHGSMTREGGAREVRFFFPKADIGTRVTKEQANQYVSTQITPTLSKGLVALCQAKPAHPVEWLAQWLLENKPKAGEQ